MENSRVGEIYHLSPDEGISIRDLVKIICKKMGVDFEKTTKDVGERLGQDAAYIIDSSKARKELNWRPMVSLETGLSEVVRWADGNWDAIKDLALDYIHRV